MNITELAKEAKLRQEKRVQLALVDKLESERKKILKESSKIEKDGRELSKLMFNFRDVLSNYQTSKYIKMLADYEKAAKDLGVKIDNKYQKAFDDYLKNRNTFAKIIQ